jgi:transcriptional regulator with XRE-family HTH domain
MNFWHLHERLRLEMLRRIESGSLTASLLAHQIGVTPAHISNFLSRRRKLSLEALDKVLAAQFLTIADLYSGARYPPSGVGASAAMSFDSVPLVEAPIAALQARVHSDSIIEVVKVRSGLLGNLRDRCSAERRKWDRFVAVQVSEDEADVMQPILTANSIALIDRHYSSAFTYASGSATIHAVRLAGKLHFRYVSLLEKHLILRAHNPAHVPELLALSAGRSSADVIVGRVFLCIVEL